MTLIKNCASIKILVNEKSIFTKVSEKVKVPEGEPCRDFLEYTSLVEYSSNYLLFGSRSLFFMVNLKPA